MTHGRPATRRTPEPILWLLFSAGGMATAMVVPVLLAIFGVAVPLGWLDAPNRDDLLGLVRNPLTRLVLFGLCLLALFHWAHRFRFVLRHGLGLRRGGTVTAVCCYGLAAAGSVLAAALLLRV